MLKKISVQECGGNPENKSSIIEVSTNDFKLSVGEIYYRFHIEPDGEISIALINGVDAHIQQVSGYAGIKLCHTSKE